MSTVKADNFTWKSGQSGGLSGTNVTGDQIVYGVAKSWINFNGISGSVAARASFNMSSVTRSAAGAYTVALTNALADTSYSCVWSWGGTASIAAGRTYEDNTPRTSSAMSVVVVNTSFASADTSIVSIVINR